MTPESLPFRLDLQQECHMYTLIINKRITLNGITNRLMGRLQSVLNAAARLVCNSRKYDRITPLLHDLH